MTVRPSEITVTSMYGAKNQRPLVSLRLRDVAVQIEVEEARALGLNLLEVAESAIGDGFLVTFMRDKAGLGDGQVAALLNDFRHYREAEWHRFHDETNGLLNRPVEGDET